MQPQGTALVNTAYIDQITADINSIDICADLQALVNLAMAAFQAEINAIEAQIEALVPLIVIPTDLASVIKWITGFINPILVTYENYAAQLAQLIASITKLIQAIEAAAQRLTSCNITIPTITVAGVPLAV